MIYAKLDWYSVVLYNYSVDDILKRLNIYNEIFEDLTANGYERSQGFSSVFVFSYHLAITVPTVIDGNIF